MGFPFAVEKPAELRGLVRSLAERLTAASDADPGPPQVVEVGQ